MNLYDKKTIHNIYSLTKNKSVIAFDLWDTLIHRKCENSKIILYWANRMVDIIDKKIRAVDLVKERKKAEIQCKKIFKCEEATYERVMNQIYKNLNLNMGWDVFLRYAKDIELHYEKINLIVDKTSFELIQKLKKDKKNIIIISDFYYGRDMLIELLEDTEYSFEKNQLYISSDIGLRKDTGNLYKFVLDDLLLKKDELLMIGDGEESDYQIPRMIGISAYWKMFKKEQKNYISRSKLIKSIVKFTLENERPLDGYVNLLLLAVDRLYKTLISDNVRKVFFCSREGQLLKILFDKYQENFPEKMKIYTYYLYVSRASTIRASLKEIHSEDFSNIFTNEKKEYTTLQLLKYIGINEEIIANVLKERKVKADSIIGKGKLNKKLWEHLIKNEELYNKYNEIRIQQKERILKYLDEFEIDLEKEGFNMVDVGWRGSIQDNIRNFLPETIDIRGYYLAIYDVEKGVRKTIMSSNSTKTGIMFSTSPKILGDYYVCRKNRMFWELLFSANHGPVIGYEEAINGNVMPIIDNDIKYRKVYYAIYNDLQRLILSYERYINYYEQSWFKIEDFEKLHLALYAWHMFVNYPIDHKYYNDIQNKVVDNYIRPVEKKRDKKIGILQLNKARIKYYFDYNRNYLNVFFKRKNIIINLIGKSYCMLIWSQLVFWRILFPIERKKNDEKR